MTAPLRIPFPVVDEVSRHCLQEEEPETVHIEVHLPGELDPGRLRKAFLEALRRHPRILMREAPGPWYRRRYEWELTDGPDVEVVRFAPPGPGALRDARARTLTQAPPLTASPPIRLELVNAPGATGTGGSGPAVGAAAGTDGERATAAGGGRAGGAGDTALAGPGDRPGDGAGRGTGDGAAGRPAAPTGSALLLTVNHTALDGPACLRILATAAEIYGGRDNSAAAPPVRRPEPAQAGAPDTPSPWSPPARVAPGTPDPDQRTGNGLIVSELPLPHRPKGAPYTVNDQLMVATALTLARWNRERGARPRPLRITMPVDDRPRDATMPIGNGTRLVEVPFALAELDTSDLSGLLHRTALRTRALKSLSRPPLGRGANLLTAPWAPVAARRVLARALRRAAAPLLSTTLLSNIGRIPYPLDFGEEAGSAHAVWFSAPSRMPRGLTFTTASTAGRLHLSVRWSRALLGQADGARLHDLFAHHLHSTEATP
ncbi:condensation protein [Streptomyces sp. NEAU-W12]|uniref:condensation protein n=1 Tax=Streptomyces sp. NEAU-W12 TaxID=2994668 RepID=UPI00224B1908|nr:condensation protein [Streptomyces sp. NEAU-W12]MCX2922862.1 condensation protein [Streptomyces sp. NEAU-W12]